jgi:23S rRNA (pseudouridine1915-N3)-methyltransferase
VRVTIAAIGRTRAGPETELTEDYLARFNRTGRSLGLGPATVVAADAKPGGRAAEARLLERAVPPGARLVALDERGETLGSDAFAGHLACFRDGGARDLAFLIGGADGLDARLRARSDLVLSLGPMVWPHMLVRAMLAEQLYRAAAILSGSPYHRGG